MDELPEEVEKKTKDFSLYKSMSHPGSLASMLIVSVLAERFAFLPQTLSRLILEVFSIPVAITFFASVIFEKNVNPKRYPALLLGGSFVVFIVREGFFNAYLFPIGAIISFQIVFLYYLLHSISPWLEKKIPGRQEVSKRFVFLTAFLPTVIISLIILKLANQYGLLGWLGA